MQVSPDRESAEHVWILMWYKYQDWPLLQLRAGVERSISDDRRHLALRSHAYTQGMEHEAGMPLAVDVFLEPEDDGAATTIQIDIEHGIPECVEHDIGPLNIEWHLQSIFQENFKVRSCR